MVNFINGEKNTFTRKLVLNVARHIVYIKYTLLFNLVPILFIIIFAHVQRANAYYDNVRAKNNYSIHNKV